MKRPRVPDAKPNQLLVKWGRVDHFSDPSLVYCHGKGCDRSDSRMLATAIEEPRLQMEFVQFGIAEYVRGPSIADELAARGYDLTTLRITIERCAEDPT